MLFKYLTDVADKKGGFLSACQGVAELSGLSGFRGSTVLQKFCRLEWINIVFALNSMGEIQKRRHGGTSKQGLLKDYSIIVS